MGYAEDIVRELLMEEVAQDKVSYAIKKRHEVSFRYDSNDGDPRGKRERITVQPVAFGTTKAGNPCFRAYQINGSSESAEKNEGQVPGWRLFLLDRVVPNSWKDTGRQFKEPPMYNPNGDNTMSEVFVQADFAGTQSRYERGGLKKFNQARHDAAVEKNPYYDFEKQLKRKTMAPDFVRKNVADTAVDDNTRAMQWQQAKNAVAKGNQQSIIDMSRQKDFGDDSQTETVGPLRKGDERNAAVTSTKTQPNYQMAQRNGPRYKSNNVDNIENTEDNGNKHEQRAGEGTEDDTR